MSALAWLFGLGALTIAFPFLFHLIRRTPKGQTEFSSLMFLNPSPPTLTRRSRLENILLLVMRAVAILLIAIAFMRPFFRGTDTLSESEVANRRVAILLDTSASMQRSGLWEQAKQQVQRVLGELEPGDDVALMAFDREVRPVVNFDDGTEVGRMDSTDLIREGLDSLGPTSFRSDLGKALVTVADRLDIWRDSQRAADANADSKLQIIVVSDLQKGSSLESLQSYQWPAHVFVKFFTVLPNDFSNATVQLLNAVAEEDDPSLRVRVVNSDDSKLEQFSVKWSDENEVQEDDPVAFYVPAGTSRVLRVAPEESVSASRFVVSGDTEEFDNTFFVVPIEQQQLSIAYFGRDDPNDAEQLQFYLRRALIDTPSRAVSVRQILKGMDWLQPGDQDQTPTLVVLTAPIEDRQRVEVDNYLKSGGTVLVVLSDDETTASTSAWTGADVSVDEIATDNGNSRDEYLMLAEIDFTSPLFQPFANPKYNDFTGIRFWRHSQVNFNDDKINVIARFDNEEPAIWQRSDPAGGEVFVFASGWQPGDSQFALSTKFVPLVNGLLEIAADVPELNRSLRVGDSIEFPASGDASQKRFMVKPDGTREAIGVEQTRFLGVDQPGIYRLKSSMRNDLSAPENETASPVVDAKKPASEEFAFAVNIDRAESETSVIPIEQLEMLSVKVGEQKSASVELAQMREIRDRDIESRQKVWKWLIVSAILLLIAETWLAGRTASQAISIQATPMIQPTSGTTGDMT